MRTILYVDGFNLYYGALKSDRRSRWLDLNALGCHILAPRNQIEHIRYFTASVDGKRDPSGRHRQEIYLRALKAYISNLTIHYGTFQANKVTLPAAAGRQFHDVIRTEEKGSDVNLAVHLVNDAWLNAYECAVVISNDSDLAESMQLVRKHHPRKVLGLIAPLRTTSRRATHRLRTQAHFVKSVRSGDAAKAQLPDLIPGTRLHRPAKWR